LKKFGLCRWPFVTHPLPDVFIDVAHVEHLVELVLNCGIVAITADVGFGKTTTLLKLAKLVEERVEDVRPVIVRGPRLTVEDVLYALVQECGVKSKAQTRQQLIADIAKGGKHGKPLLMIDDFDYAPGEVQELVKLLHDHGVNIVLTYRDSGSLDRSVKSRIVYEVKLPKLDVQHVKQLLLDRWLWAGAPGSTFPFTEDDIKQIYERSGGVPRQVLNEASRILIERYLGLTQPVSEGAAAAPGAREVATAPTVEPAKQVEVVEGARQQIQQSSAKPVEHVVKQVEHVQLTPLQKRILEVLKTEGRPLRPAEIAEKVHSTDASVRNALRKLEELGLVKRLYIRKYVYYEFVQK